jgi:hypothetical protein
MEVAIRQLVNQATKGDAKAIRMILDLLVEKPQSAEGQIINVIVSTEDMAV